MTVLDDALRWDGRRGRYEVSFLTMSAPGRGRGFWIRYTLHAPISGPPEARLWFARFDRERPERTFGLNADVPLVRLAAASEGADVRMGEGVLDGDRARGRIGGRGHTVRWDLHLSPHGGTYRLLPRALWLASTLPFTPRPDVRYEGEIEVDASARRSTGTSGRKGTPSEGGTPSDGRGGRATFSRVTS